MKNATQYCFVPATILAFFVAPLRSVSLALIGVMVSAVLSGCNAFKTPISEAEKLENLVMLPPEEVIAFNQNKAKLDQVAALESDLSLLLSELAKHANINENPSPLRNTSTTQRVTADYSVADDVQGTQKEIAYTVILGRYANKPSAIMAAEEMKRRYQLPRPAMPFGIGVESEYRNYYSIALGDFRSKSTAMSLCTVFARVRQYCTVTPQILIP